MERLQEKNKKIGFIGQGFIGKSYADDFEDRGLSVTRYSLEEQYKNNKNFTGHNQVSVL
jgi:prephenate dehydrogenase